jgi:hypothetical protein
MANLSKRLLVIAILCCVPVVTWAYMNPAKVFETFMGVSCTNDEICTDDPSRYLEASKLYDEAFQFVASSIAPLESKPLVVFCASERCYQSFGFKNASAESVGRFAIIVSPRGWKPYYIRHEMIHRLQTQQLGLFTMWREPQWFVEGMAYSLSEDPRPMLAEPFQQYRSQFATWYRGIGRERLWAEARKL